MSRWTLMRSGAVFLVACMLGAPCWADTWEAARTREYRSANEKYIARIVPARRDEPGTVTVFNADRQQLWSAKLSNSKSPVLARVSDDGRFVVTLDNWHSVGYGPDVLAFYDQRGQIKKYTLEAALSDTKGPERKSIGFDDIPHSVSSRLVADLQFDVL